jgi:hypothetical protein
MNRAAVIVLVAIAVFVVSGILAVLLVPSLSGAAVFEWMTTHTAFALSCITPRAGWRGSAQRRRFEARMQSKRVDGNSLQRRVAVRYLERYQAPRAVPPIQLQPVVWLSPLGRGPRAGHACF